MKRVLIFLGIVAILIVGTFYLTNTNKNEPAKQKTDPFEISLSQINSNMDDGSLLIDVRAAKEYDADHAVGAVNIPVEDMQKGKYPNVKKDKIIYVYCHSGRRATQAKAILEQAGYDNVINLTSLYKWVAMGGKTDGSNPKCSVKSESSC